MLRGNEFLVTSLGRLVKGVHYESISTMGRFHRHDDGTVHTHEHDHHPHDHDHDHGDHSRYETGKQRIDVLEAIFAENDVLADANRAAFESNGIRALNLMSSPGSGKTTVLQATLDELAGEFAIGVIEGDIATDLDAAKLSGRGAQVSLLNTSNGFGGECHLDAPMVNRALPGLDLPALDLVIIENVGNLVCPAEFDVGEHAKAMVYSVTEGEDKPLKYPVMFDRWMWCYSTRLTWCLIWMSTSTRTSRMFARSTRPRRSSRSVRAPEPAWAPGSAGYDGSPAISKTETCTDRYEFFLQMTCMRTEDPPLVRLACLTGLCTRPHNARNPLLAQAKRTTTTRPIEHLSIWRRLGYR